MRCAIAGPCCTCTRPPEVLFERVRHGRNRPMLNVADPRARFAALYAERDPLYRSIADHVVESERDRVLRFARSLAPAAPSAEGERSP